MLSDEDDQQQQGEGQYLLHPPRHLLYVVPLVRRRGFPAALPDASRGYRLLGTRPRCVSLLFLLLDDHLLGPLRRRPRLAGRHNPDRHLTWPSPCPRLLRPAAGIGAEDAGVLEQRGERRLDEAGGREVDAVPPRRRGRLGPGRRGRGARRLGLRRRRRRVHRAGRRAGGVELPEEDSAAAAAAEAGRRRAGGGGGWRRGRRRGGAEAARGEAEAVEGRGRGLEEFLGEA